MRPRRASSATTPTCASPSSTTATASGARSSSSRPRCTLVKLSDEDAAAARPGDRPRRRRPRPARRRAHPARPAHPRRRRRHGVHRRRRGQRDARVRSRWSTRSAPVTPSWPARWPSSPTSTPSGTRAPACRCAEDDPAGCCGERSRWPRSRVSDAERTHLGVRSCRRLARLSCCVAQRRRGRGPSRPGPRPCRQWLVRTSTVLGRGVEAGPPVDDAVALAVDRGERRPRGRAAAGSPPS